MKLVALAVFLSGAAFAQEFPSSNLSVGATDVSAIYGPPRPGPLVTGAPYSAEQVQEYRGARNVIGRFARDSQGRLRKETAYKSAPYWLTTIYDPVARVAYLLDEAAKVAHRMALPPYDATAAPPPFTGDNEEELGAQMDDGIRVTGRRVRRGTFWIETWRVDDLHIDFMTRSSNGYSSRLEKLTRAEPDPALFRPPADYTVIDQAAPFSMRVPIRQP